MNNNDPDEEFDKIVEGLELEMPAFEYFEPEPAPEAAPTVQAEPIDFDDEAIAYRTPPPRPRRQPSKGRTAAWVVLIAGPILLTLSSIIGFMLPRPAVLAAALIFVAAVIYLISQLPERGPSHPDWPDDGAVL